MRAQKSKNILCIIGFFIFYKINPIAMTQTELFNSSLDYRRHITNTIEKKIFLMISKQSKMIFEFENKMNDENRELQFYDFISENHFVEVCCNTPTGSKIVENTYEFKNTNNPKIIYKWSILKMQINDEIFYVLKNVNREEYENISHSAQVRSEESIGNKKMHKYIYADKNRLKNLVESICKKNDSLNDEGEYNVKKKQYIYLITYQIKYLLILDKCAKIIVMKEFDNKGKLISTTK